MTTEQDFITAIDEAHNSDKELTLAEIVCKVLKGKVVEVYIGDTFEDIKYDDSTQKYPAVLVGKLITAYAECLILNCAYVDQITKKVKIGNIVCLNERAIRTITVVDETGILKDTFLSSRDGRVIKGLFDDA